MITQLTETRNTQYRHWTLSGSHFKSIYMYLKYRCIYIFYRVQIYSKGEEDPHPCMPWITPSHHPRSDCSVFDVLCSLVNVTRRGTIVNVHHVFYILSHMSILNILLVHFFITIWSICCTTKVFGPLFRWHCTIIFDILFLDITCEL